MAHTISVRVKPDGSVEVAVDGLAGGGCKDITKALEKALGATSSDRKTPDFHLVAPQGQQIRQGGQS